MINSADLLKTAREFAYKAHGKQKDKNQMPYTQHLAAVAAGVRLLGGTNAQVAAGYLHDVVEDTKVTLLDLLEEGFPPETVQIVWAVTKRTGEDQVDYLDRVIKTGHGAMRVKAADLLNNLRHDRLGKLAKYTQDRLRDKYQPSLARLMQELNYLTTTSAVEELATVPKGTAWSSGTGSAFWEGYDSVTGKTTYQKGSYGTSNAMMGIASYYELHELMPGDWPAGASAPIESLIKNAQNVTTAVVLTDGEEWTSKLATIRTWTKVGWENRQAKEKENGKHWSPKTEWQTGTWTKTAQTGFPDEDEEIRDAALQEMLDEVDKRLGEV